MGGKDKQRTKGNLKPSSSGRAAELMTKGGAVGFVGFGGLGSPGGASLGYVPMPTSGGDDVDSTIDGDFRMTMRKLMKRDGVTKLKAVQEFTDLCKNLPTEAVESALPFWPRLYNKLAVDNDHRVREATQQAMEQMVLRVRRNLAPHLRAIMGSWLCCQFDTYAPVASAAQRAFSAAFSEEKQAEAIMFCKKELVEFFQDNILNQTPTTLSDPKFVPEEERETKYIRVVSSSIMALGHVISVASDDVNGQMEEQYAVLFKQNKFWKFARHKSPNIRGAVFSLIATCCQRLSVLMGSFASQACPALLSALDESDPVVCQHLWTGVLSVVQHIQDCWLHVNVRKAVLPKLWSLLRSGGNGCASVIFPNLLPFLSKIPSEVIGPGSGFYKEFFSNFLEGLKKDKVLNISSECAAVVTAFMECLRFSLLRGPSRCSGQDANNDVQEYLVKEQLLPLIKMSLERKSKLSGSPLYQQLGILLSCLSAGSTRPAADQPQSTESANSDEDKTLVSYVKVRDWFWEGFGLLCQSCLQEDENVQVDADTLDSLSHCLVCLKSPSKKKTKQRVAFTGTTAESSVSDLRPARQTDTPELSIKPPISESIDVEQLYDGRLIELICSVCSACFTAERSELLRLLACVIPSFVCTRLLNALVKQHFELVERDAPTPCSYDELSCFFVFSVVLPWISRPRDDSVQDKRWRQESVAFVVDIVCGVVRTLPDERQAAVISKLFEEHKSVHLLGSMLTKARQFGLNGLTTWLRSSEASATVVSLAQSLAVGPQESLDERTATWKVIQYWFTTGSPGLFLNTESVDNICKSFLEILSQAEQRNNEELPILLGILQSYIKQCDEGINETVTSLEDILLAIYKLQLNGSTSILIDSVSKPLKAIWQSGLHLFSHSPPRSSDCETLLIKATALIRKIVNQSESVGRLETLASEALKLIKDADHLTVTSEEESSFSTRHVWPCLVPEEKEFVLLREKSNEIPWLAIPLLDGQLPAVSTPPSDHSEPETSSLDNKLTLHQKVAMFCAQLLKSLTSNSEDHAKLIERKSFIRLWLELAWIQKLYTNTGLAHNPTKDLWFEKVSEVIRDLLAHIRACEWHDALFAESFARSKAGGFLWSLVLGTVLQHFQELRVLADVEVLLADIQGDACVEESSCHTLTTLVSHLSSIYDVKVLTEHYSKLLSEEHSETAFAFILASLCACLEQWFKITAGREEAVLELQLTLTDVLEQLFEWKQKNDVMLLLNSPMEDASMSAVSINIATVKIFKLAVLRAPGNIKASHWDFILCSLVGWLQTCEESQSSMARSLKCLALCYNVCTLHTTVARFFEENTSKLQEAGKAANVPEDPDVAAPPAHDGDGFPPNLLSEWEEFFSATVYGTLLSVFLNYAGKTCKSPFIPSVSRLSEALGTAVTFTPLPLLKTHKYEGAPLARAGDSSVPLWAQDLLTECVPLLNCHVHGLQFAAYHLLLKVMPELVACEVQKADSDDKNEASRSPPVVLMDILEISSLRMTEILSDAGVAFGEHLSAADDFEAQNISLTLMLAFKLLVRFFRSTNQEMRVEYATFLRRNKHVTEFLGILFRLIPMRMTGVSVKDAYEPVVVERVTERVVQELACAVFYSLLQCMPAIVRQWWNGLDKRQSGIVDKFVTSHISPLLCQKEIQVVQNSSVKFDNMQVRTRPSAREVAAVYTMDEISMEMVVKLAPNHPLGAVAVESGKRIGVSTSQWRSWMLQLTTFLMHQNGSIMDGLVLWKRNVDKRFEGVDDCMICFSVIHGTNYSLPKLSCKTCKKKFHSICLYKWFSKSNNSTCPLCRNLF